MKLVVLVLLLAALASGNTFRDNVRRRWDYVRAMIERVAANPSDTKDAANVAAFLRDRHNTLAARFNACKDDSCRFWAHHSLQRNQREREALTKLSGCQNLLTVDEVGMCVYRVMNEFRRGTRPGSKGRVARWEDRWKRATPSCSPGPFDQQPRQWPRRDRGDPARADASGCVPRRVASEAQCVQWSGDLHCWSGQGAEALGP